MHDHCDEYVYSSQGVMQRRSARKGVHTELETCANGSSLRFLVADRERRQQGIHQTECDIGVRRGSYDIIAWRHVQEKDSSRLSSPASG